jgi:hypothetical protein
MNGLTFVSWQAGCCATCVMTFTHIIADTVVGISVTCTGAEAMAMANCRDTNYIEISGSHLFFLVTFEAVGPINQKVMVFCLSSVAASQQSPMTCRNHSSFSSICQQPLNALIPFASPGHSAACEMTVLSTQDTPVATITLSC